MVNPKNGQPSRAKEARAEAYQQWKAIATVDTTTEEVFKTWLDDLYRKYSVEIPKRDKSVLFTKRASGPDKRFETHISEWRCLERQLKGSYNPRLIYDVGSGGKTLTEACFMKYPGSLVRTLDIDKETEPDMVSDFLCPSTFCGFQRPDVIVTR